MGIKRKIAKIFYTLGTSFAIYKLAEFTANVWSTHLAELTIALWVASGLSVVAMIVLVYLWLAIIS